MKKQNVETIGPYAANFETKYLKPNELEASVADYEVCETPGGERWACVFLETERGNLADRFPVPSWTSTQPPHPRWRQFRAAIVGQSQNCGRRLGCRVIVALDERGNVEGYSAPLLENPWPVPERL